MVVFGGNRLRCGLLLLVFLLSITQSILVFPQGKIGRKPIPYGLTFNASSLGDKISVPLGRWGFGGRRRDIGMYLFSSIRGDTGGGRGLYTFSFTAPEVPAGDSAIPSAEEEEEGGEEGAVVDAALIPTDGNPTTPPPAPNRLD